jgi:hypothetical protein
MKKTAFIFIAGILILELHYVFVKPKSLLQIELEKHAARQENQED